MDLLLQGKRALITGSTSGIGQGVANMLAEEGVTVVIHGRNKERAEATAAQIRDTGGNAVIAIGDLSNDDEAAHVCEIVDQELGGVDILFNNAGGGTFVRDPALGNERGNPPFFKLSPNDWRQMYEHNVLTGLRMVKHFAPGMQERKYGRIIQNASAVASMPRETMTDYSAAKAAIVNMTVSLAKALSGSGVTSNVVSPGLILTPQQLAGYSWLHAYASSMGWDDTLPLEELDRMWAASRNLPSGRAGRVENIGAVVCLLASPLGVFINGANIRVDGGQNQSIN